MIINTGGRTDTVQYYTPWLLQRFREGFVYARNPLFPSKVTRYDLTPDKVDAVVFCSKDYSPILPRITEITDRFSTYFYYTITAYGKDIEPGVPSIDESIRTLIELSHIVGRKRIAWRYDPVLLTADYTIDTHRRTFSYISEKVAPYIDRCIFSFVEIYRKLEYNMPELMPLSVEDMEELAMILGRTASDNGIYIQTCGTDKDYSRYGIHSSGCMTLDILGNANDIRFRKLKHNGMRSGCHCIESRDIGAYDTCPNGCRYCYANKNPRIAKENYMKHDPRSPILLGSLSEEDVITQARQTSFQEKEAPQCRDLLSGM